MPAHRNEAKAQMMRDLYAAGFSLSKVGKAFGVTRQSVYKMLALREVPLRTIASLPFLEWNGRRFTLRENGYYAETSGRREYLHRAVWRAYKGPIPAGYDVHHRDEDKTNNHPDNFDLLTKSEHGKTHGFAGSKNKKHR